MSGAAMEWGIEILQAVLIGALGFFLQRRIKGKDDQAAAHEAARTKRDLLSMELSMATADLAYANAMAIKRGSPNGEIEAGVAAYEKAQKKYLAFLSEQASEHINH